MNRDKLNIPEFIQRYLCRYDNFMWNTVPVGHQCGYSYFRLPTFYSMDFLYSKQYLSELTQFLDTDFEDTIRNAIGLGGDADTQAAIAGSIAEAYYGGVPENIWKKCERKLTPEFKEIINRFYN